MFRQLDYDGFMSLQDHPITSLLEDIQDHLHRFDESMAHVPTDVRHLRTDMAAIKTEIAVMRAVVTDHSYELKAYGERLRDLERSY